MEEKLETGVVTPMDKVPPESELLKMRLQRLVESCLSIESEIKGVKNSLLGSGPEPDCEETERAIPPDALFVTINHYLDDVELSLNTTKNILSQVRKEDGL